MKLKILIALLFLISLSSESFAQSVVITPKKLIYTRKLKDKPKEKKHFVITYPVIFGNISAEARKNLEKTISYWNVFETTLQEENQEDWSLNELSYKVIYNNNALLDIALTQEGVGAYPYEDTVNLVIDLKTGRKIDFQQVIKPDSLETLAEKVNLKLSLEKQKIIKDIDADRINYSSGDGRERVKDKATVNDVKFTVENFNEFSVSDHGVTILFDAEFAHADLALQPAGRYFFTWQQIKPFIKPDGILGKFIK